MYREIILVLLMIIASFEACPNIDVGSRQSWGARTPRISTALNIPTKHVFIAHTVTPQCGDAKTCIARMRSMQNYHMDVLGWPDIGYNYVIGGDGRAYEGVGAYRQGIHTLGWNDKSIGIAFIGNYSNTSPNSRMLDTAKRLIICQIKMDTVSSFREIHGARDGTCTLSPGGALYDIIKSWPRFVGGPLPGYKC